MEYFIWYISQYASKYCKCGHQVINLDDETKEIINKETWIFRSISLGQNVNFPTYF
jgi:hypothetical protein